MLDAGALIEKHRAKGALVDTNLLVLLLVVTADLALQVEVQRRGADALNFNHVRPLGWS